MHVVLVRGLKDARLLLFRSRSLLVDRVAGVYFELMHVVLVRGLKDFLHVLAL